MSSQQPRSGEAVRLTTREYEPDYCPGDEGTLLSGPRPAPYGGGYYYVLQLEKEGPGATEIVVFENEIETAASRG